MLTKKNFNCTRERPKRRIQSGGPPRQLIQALPRSRNKSESCGPRRESARIQKRKKDKKTEAKAAAESALPRSGSQFSCIRLKPFPKRAARKGLSALFARKDLKIQCNQKKQKRYISLNKINITGPFLPPGLQRHYSRGKELLDSLIGNLGTKGDRKPNKQFQRVDYLDNAAVVQFKRKGGQFLQQAVMTKDREQVEQILRRGVDPWQLSKAHKLSETVLQNAQISRLLLQARLRALMETRGRGR